MYARIEMYFYMMIFKFIYTYNPETRASIQYMKFFLLTM